MKSFFKLISASCLGTILALALIIGVFMLIGAISNMGANKIESNSVLVLDFKSFIPERTNNVEEDPFDFEGAEAIGLQRYEKLIKAAQDNASIKGIVIKNPEVQLGQAKSDIIREALAEFKDSSDKFLYAYGHWYNQMGYYLSSVADSIYVNPLGLVDMRGKAAMIPFFKEMLDRTGVKMEVFYAGDFKSATEPYRRNEMSEESRMQTREYLEAMYGHFLDKVSASRSINKDSLHSIIDNYKMQTAESTVEEGIADRVVYYHEFEDLLRDTLGIKSGKKINFVDVDEFSNKVKLPKQGKGAKDKIAVVYAEGTINYNNNEKGQISELNYHPIFNKIKKDDKIKAVVMRVNSPGGSAFSSEEIWNELKSLKAEKDIPIVASFGTYAASGGYYISAGADTIVSEPATLTGSIGVFSMMPNARELLNEKLGIRFDTVRTAKFAVGPNIFLDLSDEEREIFTNSTNRMYERFLSRVAEGRDMTRDEVHEVAQGRVWTGTKAKELGLVDLLGDLDYAIDVAAEMASLDKYKLAEYPRIKKSVWKEFAKSFADASDAKLKSIDPVDKKFLNYYNTIKTLVKDPGPQARLPFFIEY